MMLLSLEASRPSPGLPAGNVRTRSGTALLLFLSPSKHIPLALEEGGTQNHGTQGCPGLMYPSYLFSCCISTASKSFG